MAGGELGGGRQDEEGLGGLGIRREELEIGKGWFKEMESV